MTVLSFPEPKDMRENIEMLATCQLQTNETLAKVVEALNGLSTWMKMQESINRENERKLDMIMKAVKFNP